MDERPAVSERHEHECNYGGGCSARGYCVCNCGAIWPDRKQGWILPNALPSPEDTPPEISAPTSEATISDGAKALLLEWQDAFQFAIGWDEDAHETFEEAIAQLKAKRMAVDSYIASLEADRKRMQVLEELNDDGRLVTDGLRIYVQAPNGARLTYHTLGEAADAEIERRQSPEREEKKS